MRSLCMCTCVSWERTWYGVAGDARGSGFIVFGGSGLGTAWPVGVGVYVFTVFRGSRLVMTWPVTRGGRGSCVRCVWWERTRYGVDRDARGSGFMRSLCLVGAESI